MATQARGRGQQGKQGQGNPDAWVIAQREGSRQIKLHDQNQKKATSLDDAVVRTARTGLPDMRFAPNANAFKADPSKKVNGEPDNRLIENREDLLEYHRSQSADNKSNLIFTADMVPDVQTGQVAQ